MDFLLLKAKIFAACLAQVNLKISQFEASLLDLTQGALNDSKSSAGDKHETARAMMQIEYEKISNQLKESNLQKEELERMQTDKCMPRINKGSLIKTNLGLIFLSVGLGRITVENKAIIVLSAQSPLGIKLLAKTLGDRVEMNGQFYQIEEVC